MMTTNTMSRPRKRLSRTQMRVFNDLVLFVGMVLVLAPQATGILLHEWGSVLIIVPLLVHLVLDWPWIVAVSRRLFQQQAGRTRFNYFWNWLLFGMTVIALLSGFLVSEALLPALGLPSGLDPFWVEIHVFTANSVMIMVGVHLALHWSWIRVNWHKYIYRRPQRQRRSA